MKKSQRKQAYATNALLEHINLEKDTHTPNPSPEAIEQAKEWVEENKK